MAQAHAEFLWPDDVAVAELRQLYNSARRCFFVCQANLVLLETQIAFKLTNAELVRNPFNVSRDAMPRWPDRRDGLWRLACVGRLNPSSKGQDLIFQVLRRPEWRERPLRLSFYGMGPQERSLRELACDYGIIDNVAFRGQVQNVEQIWCENHALILPSRYEGLPVALVEALMCARPAIVTDVAGNSEVVREGVTGFIAEAPTVRHLSRAMEKAWEARNDWKTMGERAHIAIRELVPPDPGGVFAARLLALAGSAS